MRNLNLVYYSILMPTHKSIDYKLSAVKYYLSHSKNQLVKDVIKKNNNTIEESTGLHIYSIIMENN